MDTPRPLEHHNKSQRHKRTETKFRMELEKQLCCKEAAQAATQQLCRGLELPNGSTFHGERGERHSLEDPGVGGWGGLVAAEEKNSKEKKKPYKRHDDWVNLTGNEG